MHTFSSFSDPCNCAGFFNCTAGEREAGAGGCGLSGNVLSTQLAFGALSAVAVAPDGTVHVADNGQARILGIRSVVVQFDLSSKMSLFVAKTRFLFGFDLIMRTGFIQHYLYPS